MVASKLVLIPGAGGVGRAVFAELCAQDVPVRCMVRREDERAAELKGLGAEVVIGDLTRPETAAAALASGAGTELVRPARGAHPADGVPGQSAVHYDGGAVDSGERHDHATVRRWTDLAGRSGRRRPCRRYGAPRPGSAHRA